MHVGTHFFAGWLVACAPGLTRKERAIVAFAGVAPDLDGIGIIPEQLTASWARPLPWYSLYHHVVGHNLLFALVVAGAAYALATRRAYAAGLAFASFHLHLAFDLMGSRGADGYQWPIPYFWPVSSAVQLAWSGQWWLGAWQNTAITVALVLASVVAAWWLGFSPLGIFSPKGDTVFVETLRSRFGRPRHASGGAVLLLVAAGAVLAPRPARAQGDTASYVIRDFRFAHGETLAALRIHVLTMGHPRRDASGTVRNAVLILHGTGGTGRQFLNPLFTELYGPGQPLDTTTHYLVMPDGIGHGRSSRPSEGLHARFPRYTYDDMVDAQYRLLTEGLHVGHLLLVMGTSMGGMHTWVWGERYPSFMDGLVPLAAVPTEIAGRNRMMRRMIMDDIRTDPEWRNGEYDRQPRGLTAALQILYLMGSAPLVQHRQAPTRDSADAVITRYLADRFTTTDANDMLYAFDASREYDPSGGLERITAPLLAINSADDLINPPELGLMERLMPRVRRGRYVLIPTSGITRGHGTHTVAAAWKAEFAPFLAALER